MFHIVKQIGALVNAAYTVCSSLFTLMYSPYNATQIKSDFLCDSFLMRIIPFQNLQSVLSTEEYICALYDTTYTQALTALVNMIWF